MQALSWQAARSPEEVREQREEMVTQLENAATLLREAGECEQWFMGCDKTVSKVAASVNGPLLEQLLTACSYRDAACTELFRSGT